MEKAKKKELDFLKTAKGQIDAVIKMVEEGRYCVDIARQIAAAESLMRKANIFILKNHLETCVKEAFLEGEEDEKIDEIVDIIGKYVK